MVLFDSPLVALLLVVTLSGIVGWSAASAANWGLRRTAYRLECDIRDLEDLMMREIKTRAGRESAKSRQSDKDLLALTQNSKPVEKPAEPWWMKYAMNPELRE